LRGCVLLDVLLSFILAVPPDLLVLPNRNNPITKDCSQYKIIKEGSYKIIMLAIDENVLTYCVSPVKLF
tara:strand:+ start:402 stop:608 length:207 start_codon:yes stop_codon:yes gene_type:complete